MSSEKVSQVLTEINRAWLEGRPRDLASYFDEDVVMVLPGFSGKIEGRQALVAGFEDFCHNARVRSFDETDRQVDVFGTAAVATFAWAIVYEREGAVYRSTGRDLWVFRTVDDEWRAVWRTMLDVTEEPIDS